MSGSHAASKAHHLSEAHHSRSPSSPSSSRALLSAPASQLNDRIAKETAAQASHHQSATLLSVGQSFVMLPPHPSLNVSHDVLESNLEFAQNDFNAHYGKYITFI